MKREATLRRRLSSLRGLHEAVSAMKSLSAHHFRETRHVLEPARAYRDGVKRIFEGEAPALNEREGPSGLLLIGAELGLCGSYNARLVEAGAGHRTNLGSGPTICIGRRASRLLARRGVPPDRSYDGPTSVAGMTRVLLDVAQDVLTQYEHHNLSIFDIVSSRFSGVGRYEVEVSRLLPCSSDRPTASHHPVRYADARAFSNAALREFLYITLHELLLDALACEHAARLAATQSAEKWLEKRVDSLRRQFAAIRWEASTQEMIEIAAGARRG